MWTPQRIETMRTLWTEGHSASQIAAQLGGVSRNAVIGQVHRRGLQRRIDPHANGTARTEKVRRARRTRPVVMRTEKPVPKIDLPPDLAAARALPMSDVLVCDLGPRMCHFISGDPAVDARACGGAAARGRVYCADHSALCYVAPDPKKKPRARA